MASIGYSRPPRIRDDQQTYPGTHSPPPIWSTGRSIPTSSPPPDFSWAKRAVWAPAPISRNGKYYLYFGANDIQTDAELGGIGVGVADRPEGPYKDAIGKPLIGKYHERGAADRPGRVRRRRRTGVHLLRGHSHANVAKLNPDMTQHRHL